MGSEYQPDGKWVISWKDATGAWREKRTTCATRLAARRLCDDLERQAERQHLGLEPLPGDRARTTLGEQTDWYWRRHGVKLRSQSICFTLEKHLAPLRPLALPAITADRLDKLLTGKRDELSAETHNKIRSKLHRMFELATKPGAELWWGANPLAQVERRQPVKRLPTSLSAEEVPALLAELEGQHLQVIATALYTAMRKGEVGGLLKTDVDLVDGVIRLERCWDGPATKDGKPLLIPRPQPAPLPPGGAAGLEVEVPLPGTRPRDAPA
jgi:integrase